MPAEVVVEGDLVALLRLGVENGAGGNGDAEHLFEAERLGAELDLVVVEATLGAFLVFDGACLGDALRHLRFEIGDLRVGVADFDEIGFAGEPEAVGKEREGAEERPASQNTIPLSAA